MLTVQQAVFTVESLIGKVQQQKQLIHQLIQENEHLRQENKQLRKENEQLKHRVQELEARTKKNSSNSHLPPSSDGFEKKRSSREPSGEKPGGQEGHQGTPLRQVFDLPPVSIEVTQHEREFTFQK